MMNELRNAMLGAAHKAQEDTEQTRMGTVTAYNPETYCVKARVQPSGVETGWIPIKTHWVGNDWGMQAGPTVGDLVSISHQEGDVNAAVVLGGIYNNSDRPMAVPSGELWIKHKSGSFLKFLNNGDVSVHTARDLIVDAARDVVATVGRNFSATITGYAHITSAAEITMAAPVFTVNAPLIGLNGQIVQTNTGAGTPGVTMEGPVLVQQQIKSNTEVIAQTTPLHTHAHTNVQPGTGNTGGPTP